jgi:hypothetical protein
MMKPFLTEYLDNANNLQFPFIFFVEIAHTEMIFSMQIYYKNI